MQAAFSPSPEPHEQSICSHDTIESLRRDLSLLSPTASPASRSAQRSSRSPFLPRSAERVGKDPRRKGSASPAKENQAPQSEGARAPIALSKRVHDHVSAASRDGDRDQGILSPSRDGDRKSALGAHSHREEESVFAAPSGGCCSGRCREERLVLPPWRQPRGKSQVNLPKMPPLRGGICMGVD